MVTTTIRTLCFTLLACTTGVSASMAQMPIVPVVTVAPAAITHNESYGTVFQSAVSNRGDYVLLDFKTGGVYEFPANGGPEVTISQPGSPIGGYSDSGIAIDPRNNNLYVSNNGYGNGMRLFAFDTKTGKWDIAPVTVANNISGHVSNNCGGYYQSAGIDINDNGLMAVSTENPGCGIEIFTTQIDASGNFGPATLIVNDLGQRARTVSIDDAGGIAFNEDAGGKNGVFYIPAGVSGLDTEVGIQNYFADTNTYNIQGVAVDTVGNLYVSDANVGLMFIPVKTGSPDLPQMITLSTLSAAGGIAVDSQRGKVFMPTYSTVALPNNGGTIKDIVKFYLNRVQLGSAAVNSAKGFSSSITYTFNSSTTPNSFALYTSGAGTGFALGDVSKCGITTVTDAQGNSTTKTTTYGPQAASSTCTLPIAFQPTVVGELEATVQMLDAAKNVLNTTVLQLTSSGSEAAILPGVQSAVGSGLKAPAQMAVDAVGNIFVADSSLGQVLEYAAGSTTSTVIGKFTAPTGVAVDGAGNLYVADNKQVFMIPAYPQAAVSGSPTGLNVGGQTAIRANLGANLKLAADATGSVIVSDPDNQRIIRLRNFVVAPTAETDIYGYGKTVALAAKGNGDLYLSDGTNLVVLSGIGPLTALTGLSGVNNLAVDTSGGVFVTSATQTIRVPSVGGVPNGSAQAIVASNAKQPAAVAVDLLGNAYVADVSSAKIDVVSVNGTASFGTLATPTSTSASTVTVVDNGNATLTVTGFSSTPDYSVTSNTCVGTMIAVGASCSATITFNSGPGDQGPLTGQITAASDAANAPVAVNLSGTGAALAASKAAITITGPTVTSDSVIVAVTPSTGATPVPTGTVTLTVTATGYPPIVLTQPLVNGSVTFTETTVPAGSDKFTAVYNGDRVYGTATATSTTMVAPGTILFTQPALSTIPTYVLAGGLGSAEPYDGSEKPFAYTYVMTVKTANGAPLVGVPQYNTNGSITGYDYGSVSFTNSGCAPLHVAADGTVQFAAECLAIDQTNNAIINNATPYTLTPVYSGPNYATLTGSSFSFTAIRSPSIIITANPTAITVTSGSKASATMTLTSLLGYGVTGVSGIVNGQNYGLPVSLDCANLPAHSSCSFTYPTPDPSSPSSTAVTPTAPGTVQMTINTNVPVGTTSSSLRSNAAIVSAFMGIGLLGLTLRRRRGLIGSLACVLLMTAAAAGLSSCSTANINATPQLTTPKGTYAVIVTARQSGSRIVVDGNGPHLVSGNGFQMSLYYTINVTVQ